MSEKIWSLNQNNFHKIGTINMNIFNILLYASEQAEYEKSDFYKNLCNKLYKEGQMQVRWYWQLANKYKTDSYIEKFKIVNYVFSNGFEHFMNVTKKYGNEINGVTVIHPVEFNNRSCGYPVEAFTYYVNIGDAKNTYFMRYDQIPIGTKIFPAKVKTEEI